MLCKCVTTQTAYLGTKILRQKILARIGNIAAHLSLLVLIYHAIINSQILNRFKLSHKLVMMVFVNSAADGTYN